MPIKIPNELPAKGILEAENIFVMDESRATSQDIRPLQIAILNLMPLKENTELDLLRVLSNFPIQVEITFLKTATYASTHTDVSHMDQFYVTIDDVAERNFDGLIITGAPIEHLEFEEVAYWPELCRIFEWSKTHVFSTFHICWGAQAGLYYHYGVQKHMLPEKLSGVYLHRVLHRKKMLMRGMDDYFYVPQSRNTTIDEEAVRSNPELYVVADSERCGSYLILACSSRQVFVTGHSEYDRYDLDREYRRDLAKGINPSVPENYYPDDDPSREPILSWRSSSNCTYTNWLNFIYQETPYRLSEIRPVSEDSYLLHSSMDDIHRRQG
ncbi:MAG: homoserine O-succinyltransferase [Oscillospiraceae bacterium]|nr:homoserine O-succinyltransferase [Oscillospiraceae bacterium]